MNSTPPAATRLLACLLFAAAPFAFGQDSPDSAQVRAEISQGVRAYRQGQYAEAANHFEKAVRLDPSSINPRLYLATSYAAQASPGSNRPGTEALLRKAEDEYLKVLELNPEEENALRSLANLAYERTTTLEDPAAKQAQLERASGWYERLAESSPKDKGALYMIGVLASSRCEPVLAAAREKSGMKPESPGPIADAGERGEAQKRCGETLDGGVAALQKAIAIDPDYDDAMVCMSLLLRDRANFAPTMEAWQNEIREADAWPAKAAEARKRRASAPRQSQR